MLIATLTRRTAALSLLCAPFSMSPAGMRTSRLKATITDFGAVPDGRTINTHGIQAAIDHLASRGGGTLIVPSGVFVSGAIFLRPGVDLHLEKGSVLKCTNDMAHFPPRRTRIEGHFEERFTPALINASGCDGLRITGEGTLDGSGRPVWDRFWELRSAAPDPGNFPNIGLPRARLALIEQSNDVLIEGVTFENSQFWNLHLYRCNQVQVRDARFQVPDDYKQAPSSDGIDLDSCRNVLIEGCFFSVTDDCIAAKGSKGPRALEDKSSPPVENVHIRRCHFRRGHQAFTCGSEATVVRGVIVEDCEVTGAMNVIMLKLRPDTPQRYEDILVRNIRLDNIDGKIFWVQPWTQYKDLKGEAPPQSVVRNITLTGIRGRYGAFGSVQPNPGQTTIRDIRIEDVAVTLRDPSISGFDPANVRLERVVVNGRQISL